MNVPHNIQLDPGRKFEEEFFGPIHRRRPAARWRRWHRMECPVFHEAIRRAMISQSSLGWDPANPPTPLGRKLFESVKGNLDISDQRFLRLYVSVGMPLDIEYHVDCFFELRGRIFTIDVTVSDYKPFNWYTSPDMVPVEDIIRCNEISYVGRNIARKLEQRVARTAM